MSDRELYGARDEKFVKAGSNSSKIRELMLNDEGSSKSVEAGEVILRQKLPTTSEAMRRAFEKMPWSCIALETGTHSPWVSRLLTMLGHEVIVAPTERTLSQG